MRLARLIALTVVLGGLTGGAALTRPVVAAAPAGTLTLRAAAAPGQPQAVQLTARLLGPGGQPAGNQPIEFFVRSDEFGGVEVALGTVPTNTGGLASLTYTPRWTGTLAFTAHLPGDATLAAAPATASYLVQSAVPAYRGAAPPLPGLRFGVGRAVEALTLAVWALLAAVLIRVVRGLPRLAAAEPEAGELEGATDAEASIHAHHA
jgi:hypothetical protein